jgi:hypothetical protein
MLGVEAVVDIYVFEELVRSEEAVESGRGVDVVVSADAE